VAGLVSDWAAYPEWRSNFSVRLAQNNWSAGVTWRYLDEMEVFDVIGFGTLEPKADAQHYVGDEEPPYVTDVSVNTSGIYDFLGRYYYARIGVDFR
jgi:iron complex outermembrane receptor protein